MCSDVLAVVAWPHANDPRHIGHVSGFDVPSDVFARYMHMVGRNVLMVSELDGRGITIRVKANSEDLMVRERADKYHRVIVSDLQGLRLPYNFYTRTTAPNHYRMVQEVFKALYNNGHVTAQTQMGAISLSTGRTLPDRFTEGTYPTCDYTGARGDQCDNCGNQLGPVDLINPVPCINSETPRFVETEHLFLDLSGVAEQPTAWLDFHEDWWPNVLKFSHNLLKKIRLRVITHDLD